MTGNAQQPEKTLAETEPVNIPAEKSASGLTGRTIGDVMDGILTEPKRGLALIVLLASLSLLVIGIMLLVNHLFDLQTSEIEVGNGNSHVVLQQVQGRSGNGNYVVIVNPEGWQNTEIPVHSGDQISVVAGGKIAIDMYDVWQKSQRRTDYETALEKGPPYLRPNDPNETRVPEDYFTEEQKESLRLTRPWTDPDGFSLEVFKPSFKSRRSLYLLPKENAGGLVAAIKGGADEPSKADAFFVGRKKDLVASKDGFLWFNVNDVQYYKDPANPNLFYNDNIGSFWVLIAVKRPAFHLGG
jgi:hypothetical protein